MVSDPGALLLHYMRTLELPKGIARNDLLKQFETIMNEGAPCPGGIIEDVLISEVGKWRLTIDIITPREPPLGAMLWLHGGGWTSGNPKTFRRLGCEFAARRFLTFLPDYRRAPRHQYPAALEDSIEALDWVAHYADDYGGRGLPLCVGGDSAGANLAAAAVASSRHRQHRGGDGVEAVVLAYGIFDYHRALPLLGSAITAPTADGQHYLPSEQFEILRGEPTVSPEYACADLAPTLLLVGSDDPLARETFSMFTALDRAGVACRLVNLEDAPHGILQLPFHTAHDAAFNLLTDHLLGCDGLLC